jgi:acyl-CoA reductase-like NAD-dependent aldehyde dehydrogenase
MRILNPATNAPLATVKHDTAATVRNKYRAARAAQGKWAQLPCEQRIDVIRRFRDRIVARREDLARTLTSEVGKPLTQARNELSMPLPFLPRKSCLRTLPRDSKRRFHTNRSA